MAHLNLYISGWKEHGGAPGIGVIRFDSNRVHDYRHAPGHRIAQNAQQMNSPVSP